MLNIVFRADGGANIGMGHIMRCLSLARAFRRKGYKVDFFSKLDEGIEIVKRENFDVIRLPSLEQQTDVLVVDTYNVSQEYFLLLRPHVKLVYIDDVNKFPYPVDIIINGNITGTYMGYRKYDENQVLLLGPAYNMIRDEFSNLPARIVRGRVEEIMLTVGGADPYNLTGKLLAFLLSNGQLNSLRINVLIGGGFTNCESLLKVRQKNKRVVFYANSSLADNFPAIIYSPVSAIMLRSDLAIAAGGSTLYEFAACGTPVLAFILAKNQEFIVHKMEELGYIKSLDWYNQLSKEQIVDNIEKLMNNYEWRRKMSYKGQRLVDGKGSERIVRDIIKNLKIN